MLYISGTTNAASGCKKQRKLRRQKMRAPGRAKHQKKIYTLYSLVSKESCCCCCCCCSAAPSPPSRPARGEFRTSAAPCVRNYFGFCLKCSYGRERLEHCFLLFSLKKATLFFFCFLISFPSLSER